MRAKEWGWGMGVEEDAVSRAVGYFPSLLFSGKLYLLFSLCSLRTLFFMSLPLAIFFSFFSSIHLSVSLFHFLSLFTLVSLLFTTALSQIFFSAFLFLSFRTNLLLANVLLEEFLSILEHLL